MNHLADRVLDLNCLILEAQGCLLCRSVEKAERASDQYYNDELRKIISSIQDLRDEIEAWPP